MKKIVRLAVALFTITIATTATGEYSTYIIPFKQSKDAERVIVEIPSLPIDYDYPMLFPKPGIYILNKPEVLRKELEKKGDYQVFPTYIVNLTLILGFFSIVGLIALVMQIRQVSKK